MRYFVAGRVRFVLILATALVASGCWASQAGAYVFWGYSGPERR
jgi:hypothetical protein